ncbi:MAG: DUF4340 domain-containing protein [Myxococcota bacterium]|nr:DUF4340 domain-containing protein [Myxococcota bacterium]
MSRMNQILVAVFVAQLGIVGLTWSTKTVVVPDQKPLLPFSTDEIVEFSIESQELKAGQDAREVTLTRNDQGEWIVGGTNGFMAVKSKVDDVLERLATAKIRRPIATKKENHNALNVGDLSYTKRITLKTKDSQYTLYAGNGKGSSMHTRFNNQNDVYLAKGISAWRISHQLANYVDTLYFDLPDPSEIRIRNQAGRLDIQKDQNGQWVVAQLPPDKPIDMVRLKALIDSARKTHLAMPVGKTVKKSYRLGENARAHVTISNGGQTLIYEVGAEVGKYVFLKAKEKPYVVKVQKFSMEPVLTTQANELIDTTQLGQTAPANGWPAGSAPPSGMAPPPNMPPPGARPGPPPGAPRGPSSP